MSFIVPHCARRQQRLDEMNRAAFLPRERSFESFQGGRLGPEANEESGCGHRTSRAEKVNRSIQMFELSVLDKGLNGGPNQELLEVLKRARCGRWPMVVPLRIRIGKTNGIFGQDSAGAALRERQRGQVCRQSGTMERGTCDRRARASGLRRG